jgi:hypothetical protein
MFKYFDKAFFKFFFGFLAILAISFIILLGANYLRKSSIQAPDNATPLKSMAIHTDAKSRGQ